MGFLQYKVLGLLSTLRSLWVFISVVFCGSGVCAPAVDPLIHICVWCWILWKCAK